jgi:hypothetical protein
MNIALWTTENFWIEVAATFRFEFISRKDGDSFFVDGNAIRTLVWAIQSLGLRSKSPWM